MSRPSEIIIDLKALLSNCRLAGSLCAEGKLVAVVKADAYGHGAADIALALEPEVDMFAVSSMEEALVLRKQGIGLPLLLLEGCFSTNEYLIAEQQKFELVIHSLHQLHQFTNIALPNPITVWLKVDSGMHRLGIQPEDVDHGLRLLNESQNVSNIVLMTHLASADSRESSFTDMQLTRFFDAIEGSPVAKEIDYSISIANSAGIIGCPQSRQDWNRPGIMLYGLSPFDFPQVLADELRAVMSFQSEVIAVRDIEPGEAVGYGNTWIAQRPSIIATIAVGYGDGYPRNAASGTPVLVNGQRAALVGRVSMDMICVDVTDLMNVNIGDSVELWGKNLSANEVAGHANTIGYELVTRMPTRAKRRVVD